MLVKTVAVAIVVACLVHGGQENTETAKFISKTLGKALKYAFKFIKALTNLATDKTIPIEELFQQFEKAYDKLITYMTKDEAAFKQALLENLGVAVARDVETKWNKIKQELMNVAANADRLKNYYELYHFLRQRNRTDASSIGKDFFRIWENLENVHDKSVEIFFYAMRRTYMRLADVVFESSFYNDYCHTTYTYSVPSKYQSVSTVISDCTTREKTRWMAISTAIKDEVTLLQSISEELAMNIARCATYKDFITSSPDYNQAEACLKTNLEDMRELSFQLKIHFTNIVNLVKAQVAPSKYRLENCFVTKLHEATALLKSTRESMNECSGRFDSHPRMGYEDDASDWYNRHLGEVCEGSDADSESVSNEAIDSAEAYDKTGFPEDIDRKPKIDTLVCKKRVDSVDTSEKTGNGSDSGNGGNGGKDKKDKKGQDSGEGDSGELDSTEKKDKKDKKDKKNKHDKNKNDSEEPRQRRWRCERKY
ncbi:hypothetical protein quinque_005360 [Culex quinquefasciatus]